MPAHYTTAAERGVVGLRRALVLAGARSQRLSLWKVDDAAEVRAIGGYGGDVLRLEMLPDNRLFSVSADKTARVHNAADGAEQKKFEGHGDWVYSLAVHPDSNRLATGSYDGEVRIWNVARLRWWARALVARDSAAWPAACWWSSEIARNRTA